MQTTHQVITKYIDDAVEKAVDMAAEKAAKKAIEENRPEMEAFIKKLSDENRQHMTDLMTFYSGEVKVVAEIANSRPTEERVREIVREELL